MTFDFIADISEDLHHQNPVLISGPGSFEFSGREFVIINDNKKSIFEIRYEYHCSPFKQAIVLDSVLAVGHEEHLYLFDLVAKTNILALKMDGYFGHLYLQGNHFYAADASGLYCIEKDGTVAWQNNTLAIDGVIVHDFAENSISGSGEWDPPGGWRDFIIHSETGKPFE